MPPKKTSVKKAVKKTARKTTGRTSAKSAGTSSRKKTGTSPKTAARPVAGRGKGTAAGKTQDRSPGQKKESAKIKSLRENLLRFRKNAIEEARLEMSKFIKGESRQIVDTALDEGDLSRIDLTEDLNIMKFAAHKEKLNKIDESLRKLDEGTYGICEDCGDEISEERLKVIPFAVYCIECKENRERLEEFEREG